jgi:hypothetical protein
MSDLKNDDLGAVVERLEDNLQYSKQKEENERTCKYCSEPVWGARDKCYDHWQEVGGSRDYVF